MTRGSSRRRRPGLTVPDRTVLDEAGESPTVELRILRGGDLIHRELCETVEDAKAVARAWSEAAEEAGEAAVEIEIDDLSARHGPDDILTPEVVSEEFPDPDMGRGSGLEASRP